MQRCPGAARTVRSSLCLRRSPRLGVRAYGMEANLSQPQTARHVLESAAGLLGAPAILVNNAAHWESGDLKRLDADQLDRTFAVNVRATALLCKEFVHRWRGAAGGRIINLTSGQGIGPMPDELAYAMTKGAVDALTISLAAAVHGRGITVNAVDPGATDTGWMDDATRADLASRHLPGADRHAR